MSGPAKPDGHGLGGQLRRIIRVVRFIRPYARGKAGLAFVFLILAGLTEGVSILLLIPVLTALVPGQTTLTLEAGGWFSGLGPLNGLQIHLGAMLAILVVAVAAQAALSRASGIMVMDATLSAAHGIRQRLFEAIGHARWQTIMKGRHADITHALTMDVDRVQFVMNSLLVMAQALIMLTLYIVLSLIVSPPMTALAVAFGLVFLVLLHPLRRFASRYGETLSLQRQAQYRTLNEFLGGLKIVKSLNAEDRYVDAFSNNSRDLTEGVKTLTRVSLLPQYLFQVGSVIGAAGFVYLAVAVQRMPIDQIVVMLFLFMRIAPRFTTLQTHYQRLIIDVGGYDNLHAVLDVYGQAQDRPDTGPRERLGLDRAVRFEGVSFRYGDGAEGAALTAASFEIPANQITALIGSSGSGKTTVADLLLGLLEPTEGRIEIDGRTLDARQRRAWREGIAYVPQETYLTNDTVRANLRFAAPEATETDMWHALVLAQASQLVKGLPDGLDTAVGEAGLRMSGGERQRIALARALLRKPDLLILDEATSALDWHNQSLIAQAIQGLRGQVTVVTIAHRPSMIAFADWVVAFDQGRVIETGPFSEQAGASGSHLARLLAGEANSTPLAEGWGPSSPERSRDPGDGTPGLGRIR